MEPGESRRSAGLVEESPTLSVRVARDVANPLSAADRRLLKQFAHTLSVQISGGRPFHCLVADDRKLRELNHQFLGHDYATDVLSFPSAEAASVGDLAISIERAQAQADEFGHSLLDEARLLMLHGLLHLVGYDHEQDTGEMVRQERKWRTAFRLPQTLIERSGASVGARR